MKNRRKLVILIIALILVVIAILMIRQKLLLEKVKREFLNHVYELQRSGNYYVAYEYSDEIGITKTEIFAKDGNIYSNSQSENGNRLVNIKSFDKEITLFDNEAEKRYFERSNSQDKLGKKLSGYVLLDYDEIENKNRVESIKKGEYKGQKCYIMKIISDIYREEVQIVYINQENYMPIAIENKLIDSDSNQESMTTFEYQEISIGTVSKLPEIDLTGYEKLEIPEE